jgi:hypothetical protein
LTIKTSILNERQKTVIETIRMRHSEQQSLEYLKEVGFACSAATFYREKKKVEELKLKRLYIASIGFVDQHLERIDNTELCLKLMWENYNEEKDPYKRFQMLKDIILVQPYLSSYYETTKLVMEHHQQTSTTNEIPNNNNLKNQNILDKFSRHQFKNDESNNLKEYDPNRKF